MCHVCLALSVVIIAVSSSSLSEHQSIPNYGLDSSHKSLCVGKVILTFSHKIAFRGEALGKSLVLVETMRIGSNMVLLPLRRGKAELVNLVHLNT